MAIIPVQEKWMIYVKKLTGEKHEISIEKDATVRKLYRQVRKMLKAKSAITLAMGTGASKKDIPKNDDKMSAAGIRNRCELFVIVLREPDIFKVFLSMPSSIGNKTINIAEDKSVSQLHQDIKSLIASCNQSKKEPPSIQLLYGEVPIEEGTGLVRDDIFDGVELTVRLVTISVLVTINKTYTVNISPVASTQEFYRNVRAVAPALQSNKQLRLIQGQTELREDSTTLQSLGILHGSTVFTVIRTVGGGDPRIRMLLDCPEKDIGGVKSPSLRACPHCGALVEHADACKHMKCPACSKEFCFICLSKRDTNSGQSQYGWMAFLGGRGWQCGRYNTPCTSAARQTSIPNQ